MEKKSKELLRRYKKKSRQQAQSSSESSSSSDSDSGSSSSYSSSSSGRKAVERLRKKKARQAAAARRSSSSSGERRRREKREHACQKKLEAKRNHLKRKLKEAKLKKRAAAAAAAVIGGHSHRSLSPGTQAKLKKLAEKKHQRAASKERREREREKHRSSVRARERGHHCSERSPAKVTKIRIHQDVKQQKSPTRVHHQLMAREKIIIQTRTRDRTPSIERQRHEHKLRHDDSLRDRERRERDRAEREAARDKERAEALARCQERQRERERLAREKLRRDEEEKKYAGGLVSERERLLARPVERELSMVAARGYSSRERSLEAVERSRHASKRELELYEREREFLEAERRGLLNREEMRREREYLLARRRELSPVSEHYAARLREERDLYEEEARERAYSRSYLEDGRHARDRDAWLDPRGLRERDLRELRDVRDLHEFGHDMLYADERERLIRERERAHASRGEWKDDWPPVERSWDDGHGSFIGAPVRGSSTSGTKLPPREQRAPSEPDWDADEVQTALPSTSRESTTRANWEERESRELAAHEVPLRDKHSSTRSEHGADRRWHPEWRDEEVDAETHAAANGRTAGDSLTPGHIHRESRGSRSFRRGGGGHLSSNGESSERNSQGSSSYRSHPPPLMTLPVQPPAGGFHSSTPRFPSKRNMTYTNPNLIKKQQAALAAAKAAAQASAVAAATTAVAAAKAAAQSAANATTNPGILGQGGIGGRHNETPDGAEKLELGQSELEADAEVDGSSLLAQITEKDGDVMDANAVPDAEKATGELSEISDSEDDILDKEPCKASEMPTTNVGGGGGDCGSGNGGEVVGTGDIGTKLCGGLESSTNTSQIQVGGNNVVDSASVAATVVGGTEDAINEGEKADDDELLDFEEISDGELEEDARNKGVGDALGVDWASLIAETRRQAESAMPPDDEQSTTAKQKWQPHRILLDVGISMGMAGEDYARKLLQSAKQKLDAELGVVANIKCEIKDECLSTADEDSQVMYTDDATTVATAFEVFPKIESKLPLKMLDDLYDGGSGENADGVVHPMAGIQVAERVRRLQRRSLISNACGANSRALSARQDLKLRRQLCGLPAKECDFPRPAPGVNSKLKAMAMAAFQRTLEVK